MHRDVCTLERLPTGTDLLTGGWPCQDISQAGKTAGIDGARSGLVAHVFRLLEGRAVPRVLLENVPFILRLDRGRGLRVVLDQFERLGYRWAYRIVDARAFGIPQRRERLYLHACLEGDPRAVLLADDAGEPAPLKWEAGCSFGFYWTEGIRGLGAAINAVPTLKGGSTIGIPSPPGVLLPDGRVVTPDIRDAERLQGFPSDWTKPAEEVARRSFRWKLVGNAVAVPVARWIGGRLRSPGRYIPTGDEPIVDGSPWPRSAWNVGDGRFASRVSAWPVRQPFVPLHEFLKHPGNPLSIKATAGFLSRARSGSLRFPDGFLEKIDEHLRRSESAEQKHRRAAVTGT